MPSPQPPDRILEPGGHKRAARTPTSTTTQASTMKQHYLQDKQTILQKIGGHQFNQCVLNEMTEADVNAAWHIINNEER